MRLVLALFVALLLPASVYAQAITPSEMLRSAVTNFIRPQTKALAARTGELVAAIEPLCAAPSEKNLTAARSAFAAAATAYGKVEFLRIGPLMEANRADRMLFWPDRRGIGLKQVQQVLAQADPAAADLAGLQQKSVAVQGLGALEFVLFGSGADTLAADAAFRCAFAYAIAQNLAEISADIAAGWAEPDGIARRLTQPDPGYADYRTTTESLEAVVGLVSHGVEGMRDTRINPFVAKDGGKANPKQALFWRSNQTLPMLRANLAGLRGLIELSGIITDPKLSLAITEAFERAQASLDAVTAPVEQAIADPIQAAALADLVGATQDLQRLIGEDLSATLGLSVGFSSLDGD